MVGPTKAVKTLSTKPMVDFFRANDVEVKDNIKWPEILNKLDAHQELWATVGDTFRKVGLVHPFDPTKIPAQIGAKLNSEKPGSGLLGFLSRPTTVAERCDSAYKTLLEHGQDFCISTFGETRETSEMTSDESFLQCTSGGNPGSCTEVAYREASALLYLAPTCPFFVADWPEHIQLAYEYVTDLTITHGEPEMIGGPQQLLIKYYYNTILERLMAGKIDEAKDAYKTLRILAPGTITDLKSRINIKHVEGEMLYDEGNSLAAKKCFNEGSELAKGLFDKGDVFGAYCYLAYSNYKLGNLDKAEKYARLAAYTKPHESKPFKLMSRFLAKKGDGVGAYEHAMFAKRINGYSTTLDVIEADLSEKINALQLVISQGEIEEGELSEAHAILGYNYFIKQDFKAAEEAYKKGLECDPYAFYAMGGLYRSLKAQEKFGEAEAILRKIMLQSPRVEYRTELFSILVDQEKFTEAEKIAAELTLSKDPKVKANGYSLQNDLFYETSTDDDYFMLCKKAADLMPENAGQLFSLAIYHTGLGDFDRAFKLIDKGRKIDPFDTYGLSALSYLCSNSGDLRKATEMAVLAKRLEADDYKDNDTAGFLSYISGNIEAAETHFRKQIEKEPDRFGYAGLTITLFEQKNNDYKYYLEKLIEKPGNNWELYIALGRIADLDNDKDHATQYYQKASSIAPGDIFARSRLKELGGETISMNLNYTDVTDAVEFARKYIK